MSWKSFNEQNKRLLKIRKIRICFHDQPEQRLVGADRERDAIAESALYKWETKLKIDPFHQYLRLASIEKNRNHETKEVLLKSKSNTKKTTKKCIQKLDHH